jgi:hypothetical protein
MLLNEIMGKMKNVLGLITKKKKKMVPKNKNKNRRNLFL